MKYIVLSALIFAAGPAAASEEAASKPWKDSSELSYVKTTGNSRNATLSAKNLFNYDWARTSLELSASGLGSKGEEGTTAEQYSAQEKVNCNFSKHNYVFERVGW
ncbi:MAG: DUF481 domain-containing protein, partial [Elusimicrobiales bacterium]|nr:DUF481 domain-containing protein [Elusimicrobiales bacterium]